MVSIIFDLLTSKKTASSLKRVEKKNFFKIGRKECQKKRNFALISEMCRTLASRSSQIIFLRKTKFLLKSLKIQFFCKIFFPFCQIQDFSARFCFFWYPVRPISNKFFFNSHKGQCYFFQRIKAQIRNRSIFQKTLFYKLVLGFQGQTKTHEACWISKKCQNHWTLLCNELVNISCLIHTTQLHPPETIFS